MLTPCKSSRRWLEGLGTYPMVWGDLRGALALAHPGPGAGAGRLGCLGKPAPRQSVLGALCGFPLLRSPALVSCLPPAVGGAKGLISPRSRKGDFPSLACQRRWSPLPLLHRRQLPGLGSPGSPGSCPAFCSLLQAFSAACLQQRCRGEPCPAPEDVSWPPAWPGWCRAEAARAPGYPGVGLGV